MIEFYPQIKHAHIGIALLSGIIFAIRGAFVIAGAKWPRHPAVRWTSYVIDTTLVTAAAMLLTILPAGLYANGWLALKLALIVAYIVLGILALRPQRRPAARVALYLGALLVYAQVYGIARAHHPLGWAWLWG